MEIAGPATAPSGRKPTRPHRARVQAFDCRMSTEPQGDTGPSPPAPGDEGLAGRGDASVMPLSMSPLDLGRLESARFGSGPREPAESDPDMPTRADASGSARRPSDAESQRATSADLLSDRTVSTSSGRKPLVRDDAKELGDSLRAALEEALRQAQEAGESLIVSNRWAIAGFLGSGAFGVVARARDLELGRDVALKLNPVRTMDEETRRAVAREAQALARLSHPHVVAVHSFGEATLNFGSRTIICLFIEMALITGKSLRRWLKSKPTRAEILRVLEEAGSGLAAAHDTGLVHRDFKPDNIMIDESGRAFVVDFGLAKAEDPTHPGWSQQEMVKGYEEAAPNELARQLTRTGVIAGTPDYMAPEVWAGAPVAASDQYAFALVCWEALTGYRPPPVTPALAAMRRGPALQGGQTLEPEIRHALERSLSYAASQRFPSLRELLAVLRGASQPKGLSRRFIAALVAVAVTAGIAITVATQYYVARRSDEPTLTMSTFAKACELPFEPDVEYATTAVFRLVDRPVRRGSRHYYELKLEPQSGCKLGIELSKVGDDLQEVYDKKVTDSYVVNVSPGKQDVRLDPLAFVDSNDPGHRSLLRLVLRKNGAYGDIVIEERDGQVAMAGPIFPGHSPPLEELPAYDALPCSTQCRLLCAGTLASDACVVRDCEDERAVVSHCGPPTADWVVPTQLSAVLTSWTDPAKFPADGNNKQINVATKLARRYLEGRWRAQIRRTDGQIEAMALRITVEARELNGEVLEGSDTVVGAKIKGKALGDGPWVLRIGDGEKAPRWALWGWDPAFGIAADGSVVALRREE